jgi:hypothetical protein
MTKNVSSYIWWPWFQTKTPSFTSSGFRLINSYQCGDINMFGLTRAPNHTMSNVSRHNPKKLTIIVLGISKRLINMKILKFTGWTILVSYNLIILIIFLYNLEIRLKNLWRYFNRYFLKPVILVGKGIFCPTRKKSRCWFKSLARINWRIVRCVATFLYLLLCAFSNSARERLDIACKSRPLPKTTHAHTLLQVLEFLYESEWMLHAHIASFFL